MPERRPASAPIPPLTAHICLGIVPSSYLVRAIGNGKRLFRHHNLWSLTILCLLRAGTMHPYEMQRLIREWHKDEFLDLKRGSLYHAIERLRRAGLIDVVETTREGRRPERTVYRL